MIKVIAVRVSQGELVNYTYIVFAPESRHCIVIDPSWEPGKIERVMNENGVAPADIFLTHAHHDHVASVYYFTRNNQVRVWISETEAAYYGYVTKNLRTFRHRENITSKDLVIEALITPGHTKGSACFLVGNNLFTGDTLFSEGCGLCNAAGGSADDMFESLQVIMSIAGHRSRIYPGHSFGVEPGALYKEIQKTNIYMQFDKKEDFIRFRNRKTKTAEYH